MWVGTTYYFTWLDARLTEEEKALARPALRRNWMVTAGGFYAVEKRKVPDELSRKLHWFRWRRNDLAERPWRCMIVVYYLGGGPPFDRRDVGADKISLGAAVGVGVGALILGWLIYTSDDFAARTK